MLKYILIFFLIFSGVRAQEPDKEGSLVHWMNLEDAMAKVKTQPKPLLVDFYTDWCGWCKTMMKTTYANPPLANYINTYFYPVKFDAEGRDTVEYLGEKYIPEGDKPRTPHPLAVKLLNNKLMYPTTLFLNGYENNAFKLNMIASGYLEQQKLEPILIFVLENAGRNSSYDEFRDNFNVAFYDSTLEKREKELTWLEAGNAFNSRQPVAKKMLVVFNTAWCNSCKVMKRASFTDTTNLKYLKEKYTLVDFNPESQDTLLYNGQAYYNPRDPQAPFHQLAFKLTNNSLNFPTLVVLNEERDVLDVIPGYVPPKFLHDIVHYYGDDFYKTMSWQDYVRKKENN
jgi:thioredoxin-related protein